jgi:hypothetical protein
MTAALARISVLSLALLCLHACTWVKLDDNAKRIRVMDSAETLGGCTLKGEITAAVKDRILLVKRERAKVADEVEALARNEAVKLGADTIAPASEMRAGERQYNAYQCK